MRKSLCIAMIWLFVCTTFASAESVIAKKLDLASKEISGSRIYYEKCFEGKLRVFEKTHKHFLAEKVKDDTFLSRKEQIVGDINRLLGITEPSTEIQYKMLSDIVVGHKLDKTTFYFIRKNTIKDYLRKGGKLPNFKYDKATDMAQYKFENQLSSETEAEGFDELVIPISSEAEFSKEIVQFFESFLKTLGDYRRDIAVHEVTELSIITRVKPMGPYWRWFTDGFANAVTYEILKRHLGQKEMEVFSRWHDVGEFKDIEKEINLGYWMSGRYCILLTGKPIEYEERLSRARYAYSMYEAQRLIDKNGVECVKKILDRICSKKSRTSHDLIAAIKEVTGEDMHQRFEVYQTFKTREEGIPKYTIPFNEAMKKKDYEQMLINLLRNMELFEDQYSPSSLKSWSIAASILRKMGHGEVGYEAMRNCVSLFSSAPNPLGRQAAMEALCLYVLKCRRPDKGLSVAEEILKTNPEHAPSLAIVMLNKVKGGEVGEGMKIANNIHNLAKTEEDKRSISYEAASWVLSIDPNQPVTSQ